MTLALLIIITLLFSACTPENTTIVPRLSISLADGTELDGHAVNIAEEGGEVRVNITSNSSWLAKSNAEWIEFSQQQGNGDCSITLTAEATKKSRSAAVEILLSDYNQIRATFDIIQYVEPAEEQPEDNTGDEENNGDTPEDNPTENEEENSEAEDNGGEEQNPEDESGDGESGDDNTCEDNQEENPAEGDDDNAEQNPEEDTTEEDEENTEENPDENIEDEDKPKEENPENSTENNNESNDNDEGNNDENDDTPEPQQDIYLKIDNLSQLSEGEYYIGGYQDGVLHLASGGMDVGHCNTAQYTFDDTGSLAPAGEKEAVTVTLEKAADGYYLHFEEGYLTATAAGPGKLVFSDKKSNYWIFSAHAEGGFVLRQSGDIDVQLIISPKAKNGSLLRSIAGDEEGNAIILFRKSE